MEKKELIKQIILDFQEKNKSKLKSRELNLPIGSGKIVSVIGVRRSGKTYLLYDTIEKLVSKGLSKDNFVYINFEDERLGTDIELFEQIVESVRELNPNKSTDDFYFFFDEIQNINHWEKFVRRLYDNVSENIFLTGSNSKLLSSEIATSLRGRSISYDVFPLSFSEYLEFNNVKASVFSSKGKIEIKNQFSVYLKYGGFPEVVGSSEHIIIKTLQEYYNVMIYKDLAERYSVNNTHLLKYFLDRVLQNLTSTTSINKIYNELKSQNHKVGKNSLYDMVDWSVSVYFLLKVNKYNDSIIKIEASNKKYYIIDNGLLNAISYRFSDDYGKLLENLIAIHLYRKYHSKIFYFQEKKECDFVVMELDKVVGAYQVCWDLTDLKTREREIAGLFEAMEKFDLQEGFIITNDEQRELDYKGRKINIQPAYKFIFE